MAWALVGGHPAHAAVSSVSGTVALTASPYPSPSDLNIFVFDEMQEIIFDDAQPLNFGSIDDGLTVNSHYLQFDPVDPDGSIGTGTVTFDGPILGLITTTTNLNANLGALGTSDTYFGLESTLGAYPMGAPGTAQNRGLGSALDNLTFTIGQPTLTVNSLDIGVAGSIDAIRILTAICGDLDLDGFVGINDLNIVLGNWNQNIPPGDPSADPSGDGFVGIDDLGKVLSNWNAGTPPVASGSPIPEPAAMALISLCSIVLIQRYNGC